MSTELRFDDKVAIVTGAGNGLGREHARLLASRGARVVVNDLGGSVHGEGASASAADEVVASIMGAGGEAVANYDSVTDGDKLVQTAMDTWGRVDIVVNNAGILRDVSFQKMTEADWDAVIQVHLKGAYAVTRAAWPVMRAQEYGRVVMTSSAAGIYGNFGQSNYSAAKLGLHGFAQALAVEGRSKQIHVNSIAPVAASRMTETILPPAALEKLTPEYVSPLVAWLCHESCDETGGIFEVGAGFMAKLRWERSRGQYFDLAQGFDMDDVAAHWGTVVDFTDAEHPADVAAAVGAVMKNLQG